MKAMIVTVIIIGISVVVFSMLKSGKFVTNLLKTVFQGIVSLLAVNTVGLLTGVTIALNWYTITAASIFGIPACISFLLIDTILK